MGIADEKYVSLTTFRRDGSAAAVPVWIVPLDGGRVGFWTSSASVKVTRLRRNPSVALRPCNARGSLVEGGETVLGRAELHTTGKDVDDIRSRVRAKYGVMVPISRFLNAVGHLGRGRFPYGDLGVVITLDPAAAAR